MRLIWLASAAFAIALPASAHDFWLQPASFWIAPQTTAPVSIKVGHGADRQAWAAELDRVVMIRTLGPGTKVDRKKELLAGKAGQDMQLTFRDAGTQVLVLQTTHAQSDLPALRFNDYAKVEGLTPILSTREKAGKSDAPGREMYSRRAKVLVQVGPPDAKSDAVVTTPVGMTLEIVPERNPYTLGENEPVAVRILYDGKPLAGALVKLTSLDFDARPLETHLSDQAGRASFTVPHVGPWLINVIWSKPLKGDPKADFDTTFSSLSFGFPRRKS